MYEEDIKKQERKKRKKEKTKRQKYENIPKDY